MLPLSHVLLNHTLRTSAMHDQHKHVHRLLSCVIRLIRPESLICRGAGDHETVLVAPCKGGGAVPQQQWEFDSATRLRAVGTQSCVEVVGGGGSDPRVESATSRDGAGPAAPTMRPCSDAASQRVRTPPAAALPGECDPDPESSPFAPCLTGLCDAKVLCDAGCAEGLAVVRA